MKIIKQGNKLFTRKYEVQCSKCETIFEFDYNEASQVKGIGEADYLRIGCPNCGRDCRIEINDFKSEI